MLVRRGANSTITVLVHHKQKSWAKKIQSMRLSNISLAKQKKTNFASLHFNGTAYNTSGNQTMPGGSIKQKQKEIVTTVATHSTSQKKTFPGVGSKEESYLVDPKGEAKKTLGNPHGSRVAAIAQAFGWGADETVKRAVKAIRELYDSGVRDIFLHSWSRGTEALFRTVVEVSLDVSLSAINFYVFAHDPVSGPLRHGMYPALSSQVKKATVVLASDHPVDLGLFDAILPCLSKAQEVFVTTLPTNHSGASGVEEVENDSSTVLTGDFLRMYRARGKVGRLIRDLAEKDFQDAGGSLDYALNLSNINILNDYAWFVKERLQAGSPIRRQVWEVDENQNFKLTTVSDIRVLQLGDQSDRWVNSHHLKVFQIEFPLLWRIFLKGGSVSDPGSLIREVQRLHNESPVTFENLRPLLQTNLLTGKTD